MNACRQWTLLRSIGALFCLLSIAAFAQVQFLPDIPPQQVFAGGEQKINVCLRNTGDKALEVKARARILQTTSVTAVQVIIVSWKNLQVLAGQTVIESAQLSFPQVRAETPFLVQWLDEATNVIGRTEVLVYPTNLLAELNPLAGESEDALGIFDPLNQLKPILQNIKVGFVDMQEMGLDSFHGKLAIVGPFETKAQVREGLAAQIEKVAGKGVAVVWLQPPPGPRDKLQPSFYAVPFGNIAVVVAQAQTVANLAEDPQAQLNLIHFCRLARTPAPLRLPNLNPQP